MEEVLLQNLTTMSRAKGGGDYKKKEARHAGKTRIYKSNRKARILKKEEGNPGIIKRKSYGNQKP